MPFTLKVNEQSHTVDVTGDTPLLCVLRDLLGMTGARFDCGKALRPHPPAATALLEPRSGTTRRAFLLATVAVASGLGMVSDLTSARAQQSPTADHDDLDFLRLSQAATGYDDLDQITGNRLLIALRRADPTFVDHATALALLVRAGQKPEALLSAAEAAGLGQTMLALVAAWYTGTVGHGPQAEMVSYREALMYRPVSDGLPVPTYCFNGPLYWTEPPPLAGVSPPPAPKGR